MFSLFFFFSRSFFVRVCLVFYFFFVFLCVYVSYQASVIAVFKLSNDGRERKRGRDEIKRERESKRESRSPSLIIIIAARLAVLGRQV